MDSAEKLLYSCSSREWQLRYIGEVHLNGFTGVCQATGSPAAARGTCVPGRIPHLPARRNLNTIAKNGERTVRVRLYPAYRSGLSLLQRFRPDPAHRVDR